MCSARQRIAYDVALPLLETMVAAYRRVLDGGDAVAVGEETRKQALKEALPALS